MREPGWSHLRRQAIAAVVLALCAAPLSVSAMGAAQASDAALGAQSGAKGAVALDAKRGKTRIQGFDSRRATVAVGRSVVDRVVVLPRAKRVVLVQAHLVGSSKFVTQSRGHSSPKGLFKAAYAPKRAGQWQFQIVVLPTKTRDGVTAGPRAVTAVDRTAPGPVTGVGSLVTANSVSLTWTNPADKDFTGVTIRRADGATAPTSPNGGTAVANTGKVATFSDNGLTPSTQYSYALFAHDGSSNFAPVAKVTVRTQRLGVTGLVTTAITRTSVALAWTNPDDVDFTGVTIRRADGPTPPVSATDGTAVADLLSPDSTFVDTGLTADTQYSYAVFARDAVNVAAGTSLTVSTRAPGTDAVLKVNPLTGTGTNVTVNTEVAFDATDSLAADGRDLVSWSVDYGDGTVDTFPGPFGPADAFNTSHVYAGNGDKTVILTVTDSVGDTATDTATVHVFNAPQVSLTLETAAPQAGVPVTFDVNTNIPNGTAVTSWQLVVTGDESFFVDGTSAPPATLEETFGSGSYTVVLMLDTDAGGSAISDPVQVVVP
jgi:hypothetical protein